MGRKGIRTVDERQAQIRSIRHIHKEKKRNTCNIQYTAGERERERERERDVMFPYSLPFLGFRIHWRGGTWGSICWGISAGSTMHDREGNSRSPGQSRGERVPTRASPRRGVRSAYSFINANTSKTYFLVFWFSGFLGSAPFFPWGLYFSRLFPGLRMPMLCPLIVPPLQRWMSPSRPC